MRSSRNTPFQTTTGREREVERFIHSFIHSTRERERERDRHRERERERERERRLESQSVVSRNGSGHISINSESMSSRASLPISCFDFGGVAD